MLDQECLAPGGFSFLFDPMDAWNVILRAEMASQPMRKRHTFVPFGTLVTLKQSPNGGVFLPLQPVRTDNRIRSPR